jgi:serine/threonine-protein phosphatase 2B catalytic subunit
MKLSIFILFFKNYKFNSSKEMEFLSDPCNDRVVQDLPMIINSVVAKEDLWHDSPTNKNLKVPNIELVRTYLLREGHVAKKDLIEIIKTVTGLMKQEPNLIQLKGTVVIVGDIHGQYYDMIHMFEKVIDKK